MATRDPKMRIIEKKLEGENRRFGIVIGIDRYAGDGLRDLKCAANDARALYELMIDPECGLFEREDVTLLLNEKATKREIMRAFADCRRSAGRGDTFWLFYAGHATPAGVWVTADADAEYIAIDGITPEERKRMVDAIACQRKVTMLDCCYAQAADSPAGTRAVLDARALLSSYGGRGCVTLMSSDREQESVELEDKGHGAFTYYLIEGLRGAADTRREGVVTVDSLWSYLTDRVSEAARRMGNKQTPIQDGAQSHRFPMTVNKVVVNRQARIAKALRAAMGPEEDELSTDEARLCMGILERGPQSEAEHVLSDELDSFAGGGIQIRTLKILIANAAGVRASHQRKEAGFQDAFVPKAKPDTESKKAAMHNPETQADFPEQDPMHLTHELLEAVKDGDFIKATKLIDAGADCNAKDWTGFTPLHIAVEDNDKLMVEALIDAKADVDKADGFGYGPLHNAISNENIEIVKTLLAAGADVNKAAGLGVSPPLHEAVSSKNIEIVRMFLEASADVNKTDLLGESPLHKAVSSGNMEIVRMLLEAGAQVNVCNSIGLTPLDNASGEIKQLLESYVREAEQT